MQNNVQSKHTKKRGRPVGSKNKPTVAAPKYWAMQMPVDSPSRDLAKKVSEKLESMSDVPCTVNMYQAVEYALRKTLDALEKQ